MQSVRVASTAQDKNTGRTCFCLQSSSLPTRNTSSNLGAIAPSVSRSSRAPLTRNLGLCHRFADVLVATKGAMALESVDFAKRCVQLYATVASLTVRPQQTPHLDISTLPAADDDFRGQLTEPAARILLKILWLVVLICLSPLPPLPVTPAHGARTTDGFIGLSAISFLSSFDHDAPAELRLALYCDSDSAGCVDTSWIRVSLRRPFQLCSAILEGSSSEGRFSE